MRRALRVATSSSRSMSNATTATKTQADGCTDGCKIAVCGDAILRTDLELGEEGLEACDDGNTSDEDACVEGCALAVCGDGLLRLDLGSARSALKPVMTATRKMMTAAVPTARWRSAVTASCAPT